MAGERILVVDDSKENREFIIDYILKPNSFDPLEARDGVEAMEWVHRAPPDMMLLDLEMPRMNGWAVLEALRRENLNIPVILMTFHGSEEIAVEVFRLGVRDYVKKPYTPEEMLTAIETSLTEVRLRKEKEALTSRLLNANRELNNRIKELNTLYSIGKSVTALLNPAQLMSRIVEASISVTKAEQGSLYLIEGNQLILRAVKGRNDAHAHPAAEVCQDKVAERAVESGRPVTLTPQELAPLRQNNPNAPTAAAAVPLRVADRIIGVLGIENITTNGRGFTDHDGALLSALADYAAIAIENAHNFQRVGQLKDAPHGLDEAPPAEQCEISVLYADLHGYATISDQLDPDQEVALLNQYFSLASDTISARGGTLDKFVGNGLLAIFNAPQEQQDHLRRAVDAAWALQSAVAEFNAHQAGNRPLMFSIGINVGEAVVGNIGTPRAMNYTAIGDAVTIARRLQEQAEPGQILLEDAVVQRLGNQIKVETVSDVPIKGRRDPATAYLLKGLS